MSLSPRADDLSPVPSRAEPAAERARSYNLWYVAGVAFVASVGGFLFGYDTVIIAGALPFLKREFALAPALAGWATSCTPVGAIIGSSLGLWFADAIGRRRTMMVSAGSFLASTIGCAWAPTIGHFVLWRMVGGMGVGLAMITSPIYIAELSPARLRGVLVNVNQLVTVIGINLAVLVSYWIAAYDGGWRLMFASQGVPVAFLICGLLLLPESPRWLAAKGYDKRALVVLARINGARRARKELREIIADVRVSVAGVAEALRTYCRRPLALGIVLMVFSQSNGVNMMLLYGPTILNDAGISFGSHSVLASLPVYVVIFIATLISFPLIHRYSRRGLLIASTLSMAGGHVLMAGLLMLHAPAVSVLVPMMVGTSAFTMGLAPLSWIILSEIFPTRVRSYALPIVCAFQFGSAFLTAQLFPMASAWLQHKTGTSAGIYLVFALICTSCAVFAWRKLPETKGLTLDEIGAFWRRAATARVNQ